MKRLIGNFTSPDEFYKFQEWLKTEQINVDELNSTISLNPFDKNGFIIFDEKKSYGKKLFDHLLPKGWIEDTDYINIVYDTKITLNNSEEKKVTEESIYDELREATDLSQFNINPEIIEKASRRMEQDIEQAFIDEKENRPNIIKELENPENGFYHEKNSAWWDDPDTSMDELTDYFSEMNQKKTTILRLLALKHNINDRKNSMIDTRRKIETAKQLYGEEKQKIRLLENRLSTEDLQKLTNHKVELDKNVTNLEKKLKGQNDTYATYDNKTNWDIEGAKTLQSIEAEIKQLTTAEK